MSTTSQDSKIDSQVKPLRYLINIILVGLNIVIPQCNQYDHFSATKIIYILCVYKCEVAKTVSGKVFKQT